jgi:hypothetical protein
MLFLQKENAAKAEENDHKNGSLNHKKTEESVLETFRQASFSKSHVDRTALSRSRVRVLIRQNYRKRLSTNPSTDQNLPVQFGKASLETKCVLRVHCDIVFRSHMPNSRRMDTGNPAFAGLRSHIGKMNLFSFFQMSEERFPLGR